jgi:hypothetical protein
VVSLPDSCTAGSEFKSLPRHLLFSRGLSQFVYPIHPGAELKIFNNQRALSSEDFAVPHHTPPYNATPPMNKIMCALLELAQHMAFS